MGCVVGMVVSGSVAVEVCGSFDDVCGWLDDVVGSCDDVTVDPVDIGSSVVMIPWSHSVAASTHVGESKEEGNDQEIIDKSSTTPDPGHHIGKFKKSK